MLRNFVTENNRGTCLSYDCYEGYVEIKLEKANVMTASPIERLRVNNNHVARGGLNSRIPDRRTERRDEPRSLLPPAML